MVGTREGVDGGGILADEKRGSRQALQIFRLERRVAIGFGEPRARVRPRLSLERLSPACERSCAGHVRIIAHSPGG